MNPDVKELCDALKPFADLMEYPEDWDDGETFLADVDPKDIIKAKALLEKFGQA